MLLPGSFCSAFCDIPAKETDRHPEMYRGRGRSIHMHASCLPLDKPAYIRAGLFPNKQQFTVGFVVHTKT
jgi:hypothetical protein